MGCWFGHRSTEYGASVIISPIQRQNQKLSISLHSNDRSETELSVAIPAPVSGQSAVNVGTATSKCSITFLLPYDQDGDFKTKQDNVSNIL